MNRQQLIDYFVNNFVESEFVNKENYSKMIKGKTDKQLLEVYNMEQLRLKNEKQVYEIGFNAYRIEFDTNISKDLTSYMFKNGMFIIYENEISYNVRADNILFYVPEKFIQDIEKHFKIKRLNYIHILGKDELSNFNVGDKVKITFNNWYGESIEQGTVHSIKDDQITIRKYRSRSQGFTFEVGEECNMVKIKVFDKVS